MDKADMLEAMEAFRATRTETSEEEWCRLFISGMNEARRDIAEETDDPYARGYITATVMEVQ